MDVPARDIRFGPPMFGFVPVERFEQKFGPRFVDRKNAQREIEEHHRHPLHELFMLCACNGNKADE